ncbi:hypothetical protein [Methanolobus sp. WCC5]|jgi:flagellar protein FlaF|uniref:hypothetical protein n=1 Tax=Methanolobus sp. WCC5 TaxID=3125785 RepID=UPI00324A5BC1
MGFELSVVAVIFFISAVLMGTYSYTMMGTSNELIDDASAEQYRMQLSKLQTDIEIVESTADGFEGTYNLTVSLTNTGSESLRFDRMNVIVDGNLESYTYDNVAATWTPSETRNLTVTDLSGSGVHRVKVVTENGVSAYGSYLV